MNNIKIPVANPYLSPKMKEYVCDALDAGEISGTYGSYISQFEKEFALYSDSEYASTVSNGTCALHVALAALGIGPGDEVLVQALTNMATAFSVSYLGATPVPIDIEMGTWNINPSLIEKQITSKTKAIIVVHIFGHSVDMDPIIKIAKKHNLYIVEDCAEAHGATYKGKKVGSIGDIGCFSFYANKNIAIGEGGMVTTNSIELISRVNHMKSLSYGPSSNRYMHQAIGFNYRMSNITAALGLAQLRDVEHVTNMKVGIANFYNNNLRHLSGLRLPIEMDYAKNVYWMYHVVLVDALAEKRDWLLSELRSFGIETRASFTPLNQQEIYLSNPSFKRVDCPISNYVGRNGFYLPSGPVISKEDLDFIVQKLSDTTLKITSI